MFTLHDDTPTMPEVRDSGSERAYGSTCKTAKTEAAAGSEPPELPPPDPRMLRELPPEDTVTVPRRACVMLDATRRNAQRVHRRAQGANGCADAGRVTA